MIQNHADPEVLQASELTELDAASARLEDDALTFLRNFIRCPTISGEEGCAQPFLTDWMRRVDWEFDVQSLKETTAAAEGTLCDVDRLDQRQNIIAWPLARTGKPIVVINGHVDVVPPGDLSAWSTAPFAATHRGGHTIGRGAVDTKGGITAAVFALEALRRSRAELPFDVALVLVAGEETSGVGTQASFEIIPQPSRAIVLEPTGGAASPVSTGLLFLTIEVAGLSAHTSAPWRGQDAFVHLVRIHDALSELAGERARRFRTPFYQHVPSAVPFTMGTVRAGTWRAAVPDHATMSGRWGIAPGEDPSAVRDEIEALVHRADQSAGWERPSKITWERTITGWATDSSDPLVLSIDTAISAVAGTSRLIGLTAGSDAAQYGERSIPTVVFGPGEMAMAHSPDEALADSDLFTASKVLTRTLIGLARRWTI
ncbi:ArgE/DapE family deacylase [Hoyosella sp. YIM 151337]|uniref:M20 family metallopeptidase n=1 Tax=Hoyosella sp. YIM 151337 TaxID=2992742 RepID=UPI0022362397|nr:ArgE/DapE family deacylase [Hoyosella sp. YIM 151337]MCW4354688.1 ArgE/DapE family deacylase [Hoyosella sp. YIM 151337]